MLRISADPLPARHKRRNRMLLLLLAVLLIVAIAVSFALGRYPVPLKELCGILLSRVMDIQVFWTDAMERAVWNLRLPRILLACLVGACLSAAGASYQGIFQNPMASPDILGASQGAAFGAALAIFLRGNSQMTIVSAFLFSILTVGLAYFVSSRARGNRVLSLVLSGIMISSLFQACTSFLKLVADPLDQLPKITYWLMGSVANKDMSDVVTCLLPMLVGVVILLLLRWRINVLTLGDEEAYSIGVNAKALRLIVVFCATLITASAVSVSGTIGFVGLIVPHITRRLVGSNYRYLLPASLLIGALFLLVVDNFARNLLVTELPLGILTAFVGAPFFLYLIIHGGERA